jgi:hypothetical protein
MPIDEMTGCQFFPLPLSLIKISLNGTFLMKSRINAVKKIRHCQRDKIS